MYPRMVLLHKLLSEDGAIFISLDDNENHSIRFICDEIFGSRNFITQMPVKRSGGRQDSKHYAVVHEFLTCYAKNSSVFVSGREQKEGDSFPKYDEKKQRFYKTSLLRKWGANSLRENRPNLYYPIQAPDGSEVYPMIYKKKDDGSIEQIEGCWRWGKSTMQKGFEDGCIEFVKNSDGFWIPYEKTYAPEDGYATKKFNTWIDEFGSGATTLSEIFGGKPFDFPKSENLIMKILRMAGVKENDIILDSFAGSGTTAHAVLNLNKEDDGSRRFILCELGDYAETITAERVRRVMSGYGEGKNAVEGTGGSFDFYELGETIFDPVSGNLNDNADTEQIRRYVWFSETNSAYVAPSKDAHPFLLGSYQHNNYYFFYIKGEETCLDWDFLNTFTERDRAEMYIIYADRCVLTPEEMLKHNIVFKKIPRDIKRV